VLIRRVEMNDVAKQDFLKGNCAFSLWLIITFYNQSVV